MKSSIFIFTLFLLSCGSSKTTEPTEATSFWAQQKKDFKYLNKKEFISDRTLRSQMKSLKSLSHPIFEKISKGDAFLYSWQERGKLTNEFTVVIDDGDFGIKIIYFILDKKDQLISWECVASSTGEGAYDFETRTSIKNNDTLIRIQTVTDRWDSEKDTFSEILKYDSTYYYLTFDSKGAFTDSIFKKVKGQYTDDK